MSKITFRADDDLIEQLERFDTSKSEIMRKALREYLTDRDPASDGDAQPTSSVDAVIADRVETLVEERFDSARRNPAPHDVNVNITVEGEHIRAARTEPAETAEVGSAAAEGDSQTDGASASDGSESVSVTDTHAPCEKCGEPVAPDHVYCPNCGEKVAHRVFCDCGDELRSDWAFCPNCGRRTPAADVLDRG